MLDSSSRATGVAASLEEVERRQVGSVRGTPRSAEVKAGDVNGGLAQGAAVAEGVKRSARPQTRDGGEEQGGAGQRQSVESLETVRDRD